MVNLIHGSIHPESGLIARVSSRSVAETINELETQVKSKGMKIFARIDHASEARAAGVEMPPTELLVFGDPQTGSALMKEHPLLAIDLPLKALAREDENGQVWLVYNSPLYLQKRYGLEETPFRTIGDLIERAAE